MWEADVRTPNNEYLEPPNMGLWCLWIEQISTTNNHYWGRFSRHPKVKISKFAPDLEDINPKLWLRSPQTSGCFFLFEEFFKSGVWNSSLWIFGLQFQPLVLGIPWHTCLSSWKNYKPWCWSSVRHVQVSDRRNQNYSAGRLAEQSSPWEKFHLV